jgi:hypothetical protein
MNSVTATEISSAYGLKLTNIIHVREKLKLPVRFSIENAQKIVDTLKSKKRG